jgi:hypothetical protein
LKREELVRKKKLRDPMDMYHENLIQAKFIAKRFRPLHMQLKILYRQNLPRSNQGVKRWSSSLSRKS